MAYTKGKLGNTFNLVLRMSIAFFISPSTAFDQTAPNYPLGLILNAFCHLGTKPLAAEVITLTPILL